MNSHSKLHTQENHKENSLKRKRKKSYKNKKKPKSRTPALHQFLTNDQKITLELKKPPIKLEVENIT